MMYSVIWRMTAIRLLSEVTARAAEPSVIDQAASHIDQMLRRMPRDMGESRDIGYRVWYADVLGVYYHVDEATLTVEVLLVGPARRR